MTQWLYERESYDIRGCAFNIYKEYRNFHKEKVYHNSMVIDLKKMCYEIEKEKRIDIVRDGSKVGTYVPDLIVNKKNFN